MWKWLGDLNSKFDSMVSREVAKLEDAFGGSRHPRWDALNVSERGRIRKIITRFERPGSPPEKRIARTKLIEILEGHGMTTGDIPMEISEKF